MRGMDSVSGDEEMIDMDTEVMMTALLTGCRGLRGQEQVWDDSKVFKLGG